ncbi:rod shape determining protein RodA [Parelusimicrobium proximum]|uniref:FtsW/RodA/SpoVE family cell cycle protein n=1 Tax=Parelusimicrobium proximum TaxID=3228953 RepID=UPI003D17F264
MFNKEGKIKKSSIDFVLMAAVFILVAIGSVTIISAVKDTALGPAVIRTHLMAIPIAITAFFAAWAMNYTVYYERWKWVYGLVILTLIGVLIFGSYQRGSTSWINLKFFSVQPAELCRIATILIAAAFLERYKKTLGDFWLLAFTMGVIAPIFLLIMLQPDFSSIVITLPALIFLFYCAGVNISYLIAIFLFGFSAAVFPLIWTYLGIHPEIAGSGFIFKFIAGLATSKIYILIFMVLVFGFCSAVWFLLKQFKIHLPKAVITLGSLIVIAGFLSGLAVNHKIKPYQRKRIEAFLSPASDPKDSAYNVLQAQIAMGSGGMWGKGVLSGTQSRLGFVPEKHTDFILAVLGEEMGLMGTISVLGLYLLVLWRIMLIGINASDRYGYLICSGIFGMFLTYVIINFGMLIGLMPVAGIPLPLISYGGSNLVASMIALGIVESVYARRISFR